MRILLTNDDGFDAPGFAVLHRIAVDVARLFGGAEIWSIAPERNQSGLAHSMSLHDPLRVKQIDERQFWVSGTPTDCVIMAARQLMPHRPDLLLSGVNAGQNAGDDVTYSGTVAAAIEGTLLGIPSIALSQAFDFVRHGENPQWSCAEQHASGLVKMIVDKGIAAGTLVNVNFPDRAPDDIAGIRVTRQGASSHGLFAEKRQDGLGRPYYWLNFQPRETTSGDDCDLDALQKGFISVTPLKLDLTDDAGLIRFAGLERRS